VRADMILPGYAQRVCELLANLGGESEVVSLVESW